jgi:hypothetical protein
MFLVSFCVEAEFDRKRPAELVEQSIQFSLACADTSQLRLNCKRPPMVEAIAASKEQIAALFSASGNVVNKNVSKLIQEGSYPFHPKLGFVLELWKWH